MGIFRATKHKTLFKLSVAVFLLSTIFVGSVSISHTSAATAPTPTLPISWNDTSHTSATDKSGNVYKQVGYSCHLTSNGVNTLNPNPPKSGLVDCSSVGSVPPSYVWETSGSPKYALLVTTNYFAASSVVAGNKSDPKICLVDGSSTSCTSQVWINGGTTLTGLKSSVNSPVLTVSTITEKVPATPQGTSGANGAGTSGSDSSTTPTCETNGFTLAWITCPIIDGMAKAVDGIYGNFIQPLLVTKPISLDTTCKGQTLNAGQTCNPAFRSWSGFRVYGYIFLVIALLVVVFGQSIGGGLIDAYAAKKILPRLLLAAVLINLSYYIVAFMVDVTNIVGQGIQTLLTQPFVNANAFKISMNAGSQVGVLAGTGLGLSAAIAGMWAGAAAVSTVGVLATAAFLWPLLQFLLLFVLLPAFVVFLSIMFTFILRQGLIILLLIFSPIAFALYCLPNTEKYFRKWWDLLFKTLLIYPIVAVLFSLGNILAVILEDTSQANSFLNTFAQLMSFIGLLVPLFLIPFAFKISGGVLGRFHEAVNGLGKRGSEAIKGNPNNINSLRNTTRRKALHTIGDARGIAGSQLSTSSSRFKRRIGGALYGPKQAASEAKANVDRAHELELPWGANDVFVKASTIPLSSLDDRRTSGTRYRAANAAGNDSGLEQWQSADGAWFSEFQIKKGNQEYFSAADKMYNYKRMLDKTEIQSTENQNAVLDDYLVWANKENLDAGTATGRWQGIAIPLKHIRIDLRRAKIGGSMGNLKRDGINHNALLQEYANMTPGEQIKETPESFGAIRNAVYESAKQMPPGRTPEQQKDIDGNAAKAYKNLERYVMATPIGYYDTEAPGAVPGSPQSTSSAAAAKNAEAARQALADIKSDPELVAKLDATWAGLRGEIGNL